MGQSTKRPLLVNTTAVCITLFGLLTLLSGGLALFGPSDMQSRFGNNVAFVLMFNFIAGFVYIGIGFFFWNRSKWTGWASAAILGATSVILIAFLIHISLGGAYEVRTLVALPFRIVILTITTWIAFRYLPSPDTGT